MRNYLLAVTVLFFTGCATPSMKRSIASNFKEILKAADCDSTCAASCMMLRTRLNEEISKLEK